MKLETVSDFAKIFDYVLGAAHKTMQFVSCFFSRRIELALANDFIDLI